MKGGWIHIPEGNIVHLLGSKGRICLGCIAEVCSSKYRVVHSGTRSAILASDYISPTELTKKEHEKRAALSPILNRTGQENGEGIFQNCTKIYRSKRSGWY